jgi:hypothetical protein
MTDKQIAKLNMLQTVIRVLNGSESLYTDIPVFAETVNDLKNVTNRIKRMGEILSGTDRQGPAGEKDRQETALVNRAVTMANILSLLATDTGSMTIQPKAGVTKSLLYHLGSSEQLSMVRRIHAGALAHADAVARYGVQVGEIYAMETAISLYENQLATSPAAVEDTDTANLVHLFAAADTLLIDRLDRLMSLFKMSAPDFYETYFDARNIIRRKPADDNAD